MPSATANAPNLTGYFKLDGTRAITGLLTANAGASVTGNIAATGILSGASLSVTGAIGSATANVSGLATVGSLASGAGTFSGGAVAITPAANVVGLTLSGASLTGANAQALVSLAGTWNTSGTPTALLLNITNTASNAASKLFGLQVGGVSRFTVALDGSLTILDSTGAANVEIRSSLASLNNTFVGKNAGLNTTGASNTAIGRHALQANTTGVSNTAAGRDALTANTTGVNNTAIGQAALTANTTGVSNTANGFNALFSNTTASSNTANGTNALTANSTGGNNTASGFNALLFNTTGASNTASGTSAGRSITTGGNNTFLGADAGFNASQLSTAANSMALGNGAFTTASNQVVIGNTSVTQMILNGKVGIGAAAAVTALDIVGTTAAQFRLRNVITDVTTKTGQVQVGHYNNAEEDFALLGGTSAFGVNTLNLGGGSSALNTATSIILYTAANEITLTGTARLTLDSAGLFTLWDGGNFALGTTTGTKIGTATTQKLGFFNATPVVRPVLATGAGATADDIITVLQNLGLVGQT